MTREFKFRAFQKEVNKMFFESYPGEVFMWKKESQNIEIMQFTRLYDSTKWEDLTENEKEYWLLSGNVPSQWKGKPIYEGDILFNENNWWGSGFVYMWQKNNERRYVLSQNIEKPEENAVHNLWESGEMKVIGNIYQNPELLGKGKREIITIESIKSII